jgi:non-canonical (house-cleaning) NTP pyrophosphatase
MPTLSTFTGASNGLKVLVASENRVKIESVRQAFSQALPTILLHVEGEQLQRLGRTECQLCEQQMHIRKRVARDHAMLKRRYDGC